LVEKAVASRYVHHCDEHGLLPARQSAYRRYHSTETALVIVYNDIVRSIDRGEVVLLVLLDLSSAFDSVDHNCLTSILRDRFSVADVALSWFQSYLSGRTQTFMSGDDRSGPFTVCCSVPQGSVLGPIEFISYTEDVVELFNRHGLVHHLFADDKQLYTGALPSELHRRRHRLSSCVRDDLQEWCASRRLQLNASKTELIWFGSRSSLSRLKLEDRTLEIGATVVKPTDVVRDLGVLLDSELTMKRHVSKMVSTCFYHLRQLRQLRRHVDMYHEAAGVRLHLQSTRLYTVTLFYTGYLNLPSALCNECRTPLRGSHLVCHRVIMSVRR